MATDFINKLLNRAKKEDKRNIEDLFLPESERRERVNPDPFPFTKTKVIEPDIKVLAKNRIIIQPDREELEKYKYLKIRILKNLREKGKNSLLITSPRSGEGKTLTAINLAISVSREIENTVLLVDTNLRSPKIHRYFGLENGNGGLYRRIFDGCSLCEVMLSPGVKKMTMILAGNQTVDSTEIINSMKMKSLVRELKDRYQNRFIIFDSPPILDCADAIILSSYVDYTLMVIEAGKTTSADLRKATRLIGEEKIMGVILNKLKKN